MKGLAQTSGMHGILAVLLLIFCSTQSVEATDICQAAFMRLAYAVDQTPQRIFRPELRHVGYHSFGLESPWSKEMFQSVTQEGLYSPIVRTHAKAMGISLQASAEKLSYLRTAPPELHSFLGVLHTWEGLAGRSPYISSSRSKSIAASFGPFPLTNGKHTGPTVLFTFNSRNVEEIEIATRTGLKTWDLIETIGRTNTRADLGALPPKQRQVAEKIWDWLEKNNWMREFTARYHVKDLQAELARDAKQEFKNLIYTNKPLYPDLVLMGLLEDESLSLLHIPPKAIESGTLRDAVGNVLQTYRPK